MGSQDPGEPFTGRTLLEWFDPPTRPSTATIISAFVGPREWVGWGPSEFRHVEVIPHVLTVVIHIRQRLAVLEPRWLSFDHPVISERGRWRVFGVSWQ